jgi:hypothetical protein
LHQCGSSITFAPVISFAALIERTPQAVDSFSIDEEKLFEVLPEIQAALSGGEVSAFAHTKNDPVPRELPAETWSVFGFYVSLNLMHE